MLLFELHSYDQILNKPVRHFLKRKQKMRGISIINVALKGSQLLKEYDETLTANHLQDITLINR